jgi:uncharacterized membrane protein YccC
MRNLRIVFCVFVLSLAIIPFASSAQDGQGGAQKGIHDPGAGIENPEMKETGQGTGQGVATQNETSLQNQRTGQQNQAGTQAQIQSSPGNGQGNQIQNQAQEAAGKGVNKASEKGLERRSRVGIAVQEMLFVADRNQGGIGQQIREIAQAQNQNQVQMEDALDQVKNRGGLKKFFFGPDYKNLNSIEEKLANHEEKLQQLKQLASQVVNEEDAVKLREQIAIMEQIKEELQKEADEESGGFSIFGWLNKIFSK